MSMNIIRILLISLLVSAIGTMVMAAGEDYQEPNKETSLAEDEGEDPVDPGAGTGGAASNPAVVRTGSVSITSTPPGAVVSLAATVVDCGGRLLMPGLVNAHTHVPMTLLRGLADDLRLDVWLQGYMMPVEREFVSPDFVRLGTKLACAEMIRSGTTSFADMYYFEDDIADATAEAGMRAVCSQSVMKFPTPDAQSYEESIAYCRDYIQRWKGHPLIVPSVAPHAVYTCTPEIFKPSKSYLSFCLLSCC